MKPLSPKSPAKLTKRTFHMQRKVPIKCGKIDLEKITDKDLDYINHISGHVNANSSGDPFANSRTHNNSVAERLSERSTTPDNLAHILNQNSSQQKATQIKQKQAPQQNGNEKILNLTSKMGGNTIATKK